MGIKKHFNIFMYIVFFFLGCFFSGNQLLVHYAASHFNASDMQLGYIIAAMYVGSLSMVLILGELSEKIGKRAGVVIAALCYSTGALFIALSDTVSLSILSFLIFGCGSGGIEAVLFSLIGDYNGEKTFKVMNLTQATFSIGAVLGPLIITWLIGFASYKIIYGLMWFLIALIAVLFIISREIDSFTHRPEHHEGGFLALRLIRNPAMLAFMIILMLAIGCETSVTYWLVSYFDDLGVIALGSLGLSLYWMSSIPGRLIGASIRNTGRFLIICFLIACLGIFLLLMISLPALKLIGIVLTGLALAPVYPCISTLGARLYPERSASAFSLMVFSCGLGGALAQPVIGAVAEYRSIENVYSGISVMMVLLAVAISFAVRISRKEEMPGTPEEVM